MGALRGRMGQDIDHARVELHEGKSECGGADERICRICRGRHVP